LYTLAAAPAKARRREARANRGGTAYLIALCQIQHLAGAFYFLPLPHKPRRMHPMTIYDELKARGLIAQVTDEEEIKEVINNGKATFYIGFDCTADSLTAGHFMALTLMKRLQMAGNKPIALIGGGTTMIGDPSGRTDMRKMLTKEDIDHNAECFKRQMERFIEFGEGKAMMLNNADWLLNLNYIELLREVGPCFSVNNMLRAECYKQRMEKGLSFLEFNYMIMQSYDFYHLFQNYGCNMEFGGDDQWSNMLGGTELIRRKLGKDAYAMTITLLTDSQGKKMGKTAGNAVWLDPNKTSPFEFYQYWRNVGDADVLKCIRMLTFLPLEQIDEMDHWEGEQLNKAKEILAYELTSMVHGAEEAEKAQSAARQLFSGVADHENMPTTQLDAALVKDGKVGLLAAMVGAKLCGSNREARQLVQQGGVLVDGEKVTDPTFGLTVEQLQNGVVIKKGKKTYHKVML
jgi:tyrosyl-tRNA synthetase